MGTKGAVEIIFRQEIATSDDPIAKQAQLEQQYAQEFAHPYKAAGRGFIDDVILPSETRDRLIHAFKMSENKVDRVPRKKHDNLPL